MNTDRVDALYDPAWYEPSQTARDFLKPVAGRPIGSAAREAALRRLLRPHWEKPIKPQEATFRTGLDLALIAPMLMELAIECGYVSVAEVAERARRELAEILWSAAVREYIRQYDYFPVLYLADRVRTPQGAGVPGVPSIDPHGASGFATFLELHRSYFADESLDAFMDIVDNRTVAGVDAAGLWEHALRPRIDSEPAIQDAARGALRFIEHIVSVWDLTTVENRAAFGVFYFGWLAKFFGYEPNANGYSKRGPDWSSIVPGLLTLAGDDLTFLDLEFALGAMREMWDSNVAACTARAQHAEPVAIDVGLARRRRRRRSAPSVADNAAPARMTSDTSRTVEKMT